MVVLVDCVMNRRSGEHKTAESWPAGRGTTGMQVITGEKTKQYKILNERT